MGGDRFSAEAAAENAAKNLVAPNFVPGDRVSVSPGDRMAYVMFVGQLPGMPSGYWVGVQYEDRVGKNDWAAQYEHLGTREVGRVY